MSCFFNYSTSFFSYPCCTANFSAARCEHVVVDEHLPLLFNVISVIQCVYKKRSTGLFSWQVSALFLLLFLFLSLSLDKFLTWKYEQKAEVKSYGERKRGGKHRRWNRTLWWFVEVVFLLISSLSLFISLSTFLSLSLSFSLSLSIYLLSLSTVYVRYVAERKHFKKTGGRKGT